MFKNMLPGRYRAVPRVSDYVATSVGFEVRAGKTAKAVIRLSKGQNVTFRLKETEDDRMPGSGWVGYRLTRHGSDKPIFEDDRGPCWGSVCYLSENAPRSTGVRLAPGVYDLMAVFRRESRQYSMSSDRNVWSTSRTITVVPGKDVAIEMAWKE